MEYVATVLVMVFVKLAILVQQLEHACLLVMVSLQNLVSVHQLQSVDTLECVMVTELVPMLPLLLFVRTRRAVMLQESYTIQLTVLVAAMFVQITVFLALICGHVREGLPV
jgi:hypothetical protein